MSGNTRNRRLYWVTACRKIGSACLTCKINSSRCKSHSSALGSLLGSQFISCALIALIKHSVPWLLSFINLALLFFFKILYLLNAGYFVGRAERLSCANIVLGVVPVLLTYLILSTTQHNKQMRILRPRKAQ